MSDKLQPIINIIKLLQKANNTVANLNKTMIFVNAMFIGHNLPKIYKREVIQKGENKYNIPLHSENDPNVKLEAQRVKDFGGGLEE